MRWLLSICLRLADLLKGQVVYKGLEVSKGMTRPVSRLPVSQSPSKGPARGYGLLGQPGDGAVALS